MRQKLKSPRAQSPGCSHPSESPRKQSAVVAPGRCVSATIPGMKKLWFRRLIGSALFLTAGLMPLSVFAQRTSTGTGFFITADGYFITCFHVVVNSGKITLQNLKGDKFDARAIAVDRSNDLALLKVEPLASAPFKPLPLVASGDVRRGAAIVTMGFPNINQQGIEPKVTDGIVNSFSGANNDQRVFQISAPVQTGNSGGPLITMEGNVVGVVASKLDAAAMARQTGDIPQNVNYAIKSQHVLDMLEKVATQIPALRDRLARPLSGEKARVSDVVPALEDAIALVLASPAQERVAERAQERVQERAPENPQQRAQENRPQSQSTDDNSRRPAPGADQRPVPPAPDAGTPANPDERAQRFGRMVAEYRQLQAQVNALNFDELTLLNQANMLKLMLRFDQSPLAAQRQADLTSLQRRLDDVGTKKAEMVKRMNELAAEYRSLQQGNT